MDNDAVGEEVMGLFLYHQIVSHLWTVVEDRPHLIRSSKSGNVLPALGSTLLSYMLGRREDHQVRQDIVVRALVEMVNRKFAWIEEHKVPDVSVAPEKV